MKIVLEKCILFIMVFMLFNTCIPAEASVITMPPQPDSQVMTVSVHQAKSSVIASSVKADPAKGRTKTIKKSDLAREIDIIAVSAISIILVLTLGYSLYRKFVFKKK